MVQISENEADGLVDDGYEWDSDWDTDDELQREFLDDVNNDVASSSAGSSVSPTTINHFILMGFPEEMVIQAVKENDKDDTEAILNTILTCMAIGKSPGEDPSSSSKLYSPHDELSDGDNTCSSDEGSRGSIVARDRTISLLLDMGYELEDALTALEKCGVSIIALVLTEATCLSGTDAPMEALTDFIFATNVVKDDNSDVMVPVLLRTDMKRKSADFDHWTRKKQRKRIKFDQSNVPTCLPRGLVGFGVPGSSSCVSWRKLPDDAVAPPFFYYENVRSTPKGTWDQISSFLYGIEPEFVDSVHFSAAARKRGYIHNLPINNRQPLHPIPPKTIHEALPETKNWWPSWDRRTTLTCLLTCVGSAVLTEKIRKRVQTGNPSESDKEWVIQQCKKWNLVWVGKHRVAPLEPQDMELLLGFPIGHTRGFSRTDRYKSLGNSFQVDTVAYHLSVLKPLFPSGLNVLSLFSGIGGAEVALHRLEIPLKNVVSIEKSAVNRDIMRGWWNETNQQGNLIHIDDVQDVDESMIRDWINRFSGFDLVIGGSPCNNLSGINRRTRDGLEGEHSCLFYHYWRILECVRSLMKGRNVTG